MPRKNAPTYSRAPALLKAIGIPLVVGLWEYGNMGINWISKKTTYLIHSNKLDNLAYWFTPGKLTGVTLGSQIFIKACGKHSPAINYVEKSLIGLEYWSLIVASGTATKAVLDKVVNFDQLINKGISVATGMTVGALTGTIAQAYTEGPIDTGMKWIDKGFGLVIGGLAGASSSIIGDYGHTE